MTAPVATPPLPSETVREVRPQRGFQEQFLSTRADIGIGGGAAGSGKSYALLLDPLRFLPKNIPFFGTCFRRTFPEIMDEGGLWDTSVQLYRPLGVRSVRSQAIHHFSNIMRLRFGHLESEAQLTKRGGSQVPWIAFDELATFTEPMLWYMMARNRTTHPGIRPYMRATCNPEPGWLAELLDWWLQDDGFPNRSRSGVLRYFSRSSTGELIWGDSVAEVARLANVPELFVKSLTFIPGTLEDNPALRAADPYYEANLNSLTYVNKQRLLYGNWKVRAMAGNVFPSDRLELLTALPFALKKAPSVRYWDKAGSKNKGSDYTVGARLTYWAEAKKFVIHDIVRGKWEAHERNSIIRMVAAGDGEHVWQGFEQEGGSGGKESAQTSVLELPGFKVFVESPDTNKIARADSFAAQWQAGNVATMNFASLAVMIDETANFPDGPHDDIVDGLSGAFRKLSAMIRSTAVATDARWQPVRR